MKNLIEKAAALPPGPARRKLLLAAVNSRITATYVKAGVPTFILREELFSTTATAAEVEEVARSLSISTREVKTAFPRCGLKIAVRFFKGAFVSLIEFPGANLLDIQKYMSENYKSDPYALSASSLLSAPTVDSVPYGKLTLSWTNEGDVVLFADREIKGAVAAKVAIAVFQESDALPGLLRPIYDAHTSASVVHPPTVGRFPETKLSLWTGAKWKSFPSSGEFMGFLNDIRDLKVKGYTLDFSESMIQKHVKSIERENAWIAEQKAKWALHGFSKVETTSNVMNPRGNGHSAYTITPALGVDITMDIILRYFKGTYTPECGDSLNASPSKNGDGTWGVYISRWSCD